MRLGGLIFQKWNTPEEWAKAALQSGYSAVYFPVDYTADIAVIDGYKNAAKEHDLVIAEVGVWNNTLHPDQKKRQEAIHKAVKQLELAEYVGAKCCVNLAGSCSEQWDGHHRNNFTERTFDEIVLTTQKIIDEVNPKSTKYSLEPMPWMYPNTADSYLALLKYVNRKGFGVHIDMVNVITNPVDYYNNGALIREWFDKLGEHILSCHGKDIILSPNLTVHLDECRPGLGELDYITYLDCISKLDGDVCLMLEHMTEEMDYIESVEFLTSLSYSFQ